ncbi:hypothetical protein [Ancylomarina longa]|uniref:Polysaccharide deacetylase n=1 Tax=Ancylomarina longa TaxID=2487017 RepID=A0A434AZA9_9BACT|nr:hypothetical protein [Ancylomarina longa]RUT79876.1 hypothetical protein DLK05_00535 [Ancylomarina longa]
MQFDFTLDIYKKILLCFKTKGYEFQTFSEYLTKPKEKVILLRNDVDRMPENALILASIQKSFEIMGSYYFRTVETSMNEDIIKEIAGMGHEIGYHYENLDTVAKGFRSVKNKNHLLDMGILDFQTQLKRLRELAPIETICMHGSPISKFNNKDLWKKFDYTDFGIIGESYIDIDFNEVLYLTDTGRRWDGFNVSVRDKINGQQMIWEKNGMVFKTSFDIINAIDNDLLPSKIMMTFHPQRWNQLNSIWCKELILQNIKNPVKKLLIHFRDLNWLIA